MKSIEQLISLTGRKALVTGGAGHIGGAAAEALVELGAKVAILDIDEGACQSRAGELDRKEEGCVLPFPCDLLDEESTRDTAKTVLNELGGLDILIHCAGYVGTTEMPGWIAPFSGQSVEAWDAAMRVNLTSAFVLSQEVATALEESGHGSIIYYASTYGLVAPDYSLYEGTGMGAAAAYGASKAGLLQLMRYLASVLGPSTRVNAITPGGVLRGQDEQFVQRYTARTQLKRMAIEEDFKGAVAYLASDMSSYVTGHNLVVDGGWTAW